MAPQQIPWQLLCRQGSELLTHKLVLAGDPAASWHPASDEPEGKSAPFY
jgi:hypothetical protein